MSLIVALVVLIFAMANNASLDTLVFIIMIGWLSLLVEAIWRRIDTIVTTFIEIFSGKRDK